MTSPAGAGHNQEGDTMPSFPWKRATITEAKREAPPAEKRKAALAELAAVEADEAAELPAAIEATAKRKTASDNADSFAKRSAQDYRAAYASEQRLRGSLAHRRSRAEAALKTTASPEIATFIEAIRAELKQLETGGHQRGGALSGYRLADGTAHKVEHSTRASLVARMKGCREAVQAAEALRLRDLDEEGVVASLRKLWDALPAVKVEPVKPIELPSVERPGVRVVG